MTARSESGIDIHHRNPPNKTKGHLMPYADPDQKRARDRAYYNERREALIAQHRDYYQRTKTARYAATTAYNARHPEMVKRIHYANRSNQRAAQRGAPGKLYARDLKALCGPCAYCGGVQETWDHVIPLSRGGSNTLDNLAPCCRACNRSKGARTPDEWKASGCNPAT